MSNCQLCGSPVSINGAEATCISCGAEYDVIRNGRRDFAKSAEVSMNAEKIPTASKIYLWNDARTERLEGKTVYVGSKVNIEANIFTTGGSPVNGRTLRIFHKVDVGAWEKIAEGPTGTVDAGYFYYTYTIPAAGIHSFYSDFAGDATYAGCPSKVHGLMVATQHYAVSPEVSLEAASALTVVVKDMIFRKPIEGARVVVDTFEAVTDASGMAVFDALAPGSYALTVSARDYKSGTRSVELTTAGMVVEVHLIHLAAIALGIVGGAGVGLIVVHKALKRK